MGKPRTGRYPRAWCVVRFEDGPRAFLHRRFGWVQHPIGERGSEIELPAPARQPPEFVARERLIDCGELSVVLEKLPKVRIADPAMACFKAARRRGMGAGIQALSVNEEGPVREHIRTLEGGGVEIYYDATRGGTGPRGWYYRECDKIDADLAAHRCADSRLLEP